MFRHVAAFELRYQLRSPIFWGTSIIFLLLALVSVASDDIRIGWGGQVFRNAPFAIALNGMIWTIFAIFIATALVSTVVLRDEETGFGPIIQSTPLSKFNYLFGRFTGGFVATSLAFLSVPIGLLIATLMPGTDPDTLGPMRIGDYLYVYLFLCVPTLFIISVAFFSLATITRSVLATYIGALVVLAIYLFTSSYLGRPEFGAGATLADPFGLASMSYVTQHWTAFDRNTTLPPIGGLFLENRGLWLAISVALLAFAWRSFVRKGFTPDRKPARGGSEAAAVAPRRPALAAPKPPAHRALGWAPLVALTRYELLGVLRSPAFFVMLGFALINTVVGLWLAGDDRVTTIYPVTRIMIQTLATQFMVIPLFVATFYAGELVWRDRERRIHEIVDSTPSPDWAFLVPKILAISAVLFAMGLMSIVAAIAVQLLKGFTDIEYAHYLTWYFAPWFVTMLLYAVLAVFVQTLVPHKFVGLLVMLLYYVAQATLPTMGLESHLYLYATTPPVPLSDMNGLGKFAGYAAWYRAYWAAGAVILVVLSYGLWRRGGSAPLGMRIRRLPVRLAGAPALIGGGAAAVMAGLGAFIYYNNYVLNDFPTYSESQRWAADYEKALLPLESDPQPRITDITLDIDLYPDAPRAIVTGKYVIENKTGAPLEKVYVSWPTAQVQKNFLGTQATPELKMLALDVGGAKLVRAYPRFNFQIYRFDTPMAPGERREIRFKAMREQRGFRNSSNEERIVSNGTFLDNYSFAPFLGVLRLAFLEDRATRRKYGLKPALTLSKLEDERGRAFNYLRHDSDYVNTDITMRGPADRTLLAPGHQVSNQIVDGRRVTRFQSEAPILNFYSVQAARYAIRKDRWKDIGIEVYYHPAHTYNIDRMVSVVRDALNYYTTNFGPYQFRQFRIVEFPAYNNFAQAFPGTVPYSEAAGFVTRIDQSKGVDFIAYVTAHELAHQWWFHQLTGADMQGSTVLSETLAQYSALMVMEKRYGPAMIQRFQKAAVDGYLTARGKENVAEPTLERVENQAYVRYQKGGAVMYLLKQRMGEAAINRALRSLLAKYAFKGAPYPTSRDLVAALRAEAKPSEQQLITDLFQKITLYDLKAENAQASRRADGKWIVTFNVEAHKRYADGKGIEKEAPLDEPIDVGLFTVDPGSDAFRPADVLSVQTQRLQSGRRKLTIVTDRKPAFVGVDPYLNYIDRISEDNIASVN